MVASYHQMLALCMHSAEEIGSLLLEPPTARSRAQPAPTPRWRSCRSGAIRRPSAGLRYRSGWRRFARVSGGLGHPLHVVGEPAVRTRETTDQLEQRGTRHQAPRRWTEDRDDFAAAVDLDRLARSHQRQARG